MRLSADEIKLLTALWQGQGRPVDLATVALRTGLAYEHALAVWWGLAQKGYAKLWIEGCLTPEGQQALADITHL